MIGAVLAVLLAASAPAGARDADAQLQCDAGPATKTLGGNDWLVYACADGESVVVVAGASNPATPFFFMVRPERMGIAVYGEGTGDKAATEPAYNALKDMSPGQLAALYRQAVAAGRD